MALKAPKAPAAPTSPFSKIEWKKNPLNCYCSVANRQHCWQLAADVSSRLAYIVVIVSQRIFMQRADSSLHRQ